MLKTIILHLLFLFLLKPVFAENETASRASANSEFPKKPLPAEPASQNCKKAEWGAGMLFLRMNHYRGSDQSKNHYLPLPYFSYTGDRLEAETSVVRGILYKNSFIAFKLSFMLGLAVESEENEARQGMPDIPYIFEAGPMIIFYLWESPGKKHKLTLECPLRYVFASDFKSTEHVGIFSVPYLNYTIFPHKYTFNWQLELSAAIMYGNKDYHNYFYAVKKKYATSERPEYYSKGGYSGMQYAIVANKKIWNIKLIPFFRYDYLKNTVFEDSPLVKTKHFFAFGIGTFYIF